MKTLRAFLQSEESGQTLIFFAILAGALFMIMGVAVEGGNVLMQYRKMQSAADMSALVGAQSLPCAPTDSTCINTALQTACNTAQENGFGGGWNGSTCSSGGGTAAFASSATAVTPAVPPTSCSPYDFIDYGNNSTNSVCSKNGARTNSTATKYYYIEVQLQQTFTVPIFNISFPLYSHAVARKGIGSAREYAIAVLDPTASRALDFSGSSGGSLLIFGSAISDSTASDSIYTGNNAAPLTCDGGWFTSSSESAPSGVQSNSGGVAAWSPAVCVGGSTDSPAKFYPNTAPIADPYAAGSAPPSSMSNCTPCGSTAYYYHWSDSSHRDSGTWGQATSKLTISSGSSLYELFPGVYNGIKITGGTIYLNPGVYTVDGSVSISGANVCVYGAPVCDGQVNTQNSSVNCSSTSFLGTDSNYVASSYWYYYCSPWGMWDPKVSQLGSSPPASLGTAPTFTNGTTPLNGVTFYMNGGSFSVDGTSTGGTQPKDYLAFPNPCPGTSTQTSSNQVPWPAGASNGSYSYPAGSLPNLDAVTSSSAYSTMLYPSIDFSLNGECSNASSVWSGELGTNILGQHMHFLVWMRDATNSVTFAGGGTSNFYGIIYNPANYASGGGCGTSCQVKVGGNATSGDGPPMFTGQIIADNAVFTGSANVNLYYAPCVAGSTPCALGTGTGLVQ